MKVYAQIIKQNQRGNILFLILLAVVLFAALSYAVTSSMRGGGKDGGTESVQTSISQFMNYATLVESTITRLKLINGCKDNELSFEYDTNSNDVYNDSSDLYYNSDAPTDLSCHIFHSNGGNISYEEPPEAILAGVNGLLSGGTDVLASFFDARRVIKFFGNSVLNAGGNEVTIRTQVTEQVCEEINKKFRSTSTIPTDGWPHWTRAKNVDSTSPQQQLGGSSFCPECKDHKTMCFLQTGGPNNVHQFYHIVMER